jgi:hypothetical protein
MALRYFTYRNTVFDICALEVKQHEIVTSFWHQIEACRMVASVAILEFSATFSS